MEFLISFVTLQSHETTSNLKTFLTQIRFEVLMKREISIKQGSKMKSLENTFLREKRLRKSNKKFWGLQRDRMKEDRFEST